MLKIIQTICLVFFLWSSSSAQQINYDKTIKVGAERTALYLPLLEGKKIVVVGNQTSTVNDKHLVDYLLDQGIEVSAVFAPEHGFRGKADAGAKIKDGKDVKTGLQIFSLYGKNKKPSAKQLIGVEYIVFDIQDVGARFYTYISTLHYVMEAAAENKVKVLILDRPNPNGFYVDGPVLKKEHKSFVGMHPVPVVHGMTIGEYAQMINGEKWLNNGIQCQLDVIRCLNYDHLDFYKLPILPSPNLKNMDAIYLYPSLCFFEGTQVSVGRGTTAPFTQIGSPFHSIKNKYKFVPKPMSGAKYPKYKSKKCFGYDLSGKGYEIATQGKKLEWRYLKEMYQKSTKKSQFFVKNGFFQLLTGDKQVKTFLQNGTFDAYLTTVQDEVNVFKLKRKKYLLYKDFE